MAVGIVWAIARDSHMRRGVLFAEGNLWKPVLQIIHDVPAVCKTRTAP